MIAVETAKRMLTKEKIDKQLAGQTSSTPFISVRDSQNKRVTFNTADNLEQKIGTHCIAVRVLVWQTRGIGFKSHQGKFPFLSRVFQRIFIIFSMTKTLENLYYLDDGRPSRQMCRTDVQW